MSISLEQAKNLKHGDILLSTIQRNAKDFPIKWKVNGRVKLWKRSPDRVQVPIKHGLYSYDYLTEDSLHLVNLEELY